MTKAESEIGNANLNVVGGELGNVRAMLDVCVDDGIDARCKTTPTEIKFYL